MTEKLTINEPLELDVPDGVAEAAQAVEVIRAFVSDGSLHVALNSDAFGQNIEDWGRLLGQIAHHVARAAELNGHVTQSEALQALRRGYEQTLPQHQTTMSGGIQGRVRH